LIMHPYLKEVTPRYDRVVEELKTTLSGLRTGRANPAMVENISVPAYESTTELKGLASITAEDATTLVVSPWDKNLLQAVEKAIRDADLGINPAVDGEIVRINLPPMTEENRKQLVKKVHGMLEDAKIKLRKTREDTRDTVSEMEKEKEIGEDEKYKILDEIDTVTREYTEKIDEIGKKKETAILTV